MATILCVLYDDPVDGYPPDYPRDEIPRSRSTPTARRPRPRSRLTSPGELLGCVSGSSRLRKFLEAEGHALIVTSDKDGPDSSSSSGCRRRTW